MQNKQWILEFGKIIDGLRIQYSYIIRKSEVELMPHLDWKEGFVDVLYSCEKCEEDKSQTVKD